MYHESNLETMSRMADNSVDSIVTDPPYGLKFMGKKWDYDVPPVEVWVECLRVLKPGGYLLAFAGTRTQHRMAVRIEDAGFEIRDMIMWCYGSGFPKSHNVSKAIDKKLGATRTKDRVKYSENVLMKSGGNNNRPWMDEAQKNGFHEIDSNKPITDEAKLFDGWGTALKPALEPITVARKPIEGTVAANVLKYGTGGINIDGCRVEHGGESLRGGAEDGSSANKVNAGWDRPWKNDPEKRMEAKQRSNENQERSENLGRFPANLIHDGSEEVLALFPETQSGKMSESHKRSTDGSPNGIYGKFDSEHPLSETFGDSGSAARFFYTAKASQSERGKGNDHPTVKPLAVMRYLCRLVTPPKGIIYDPYAGSGTTIIAGIEEGFSAFGSDLDAHHCDIFNLRTRHGIQPKMF